MCITNALNGGGQIANFASRKLPNIDQPLCIHIASLYNGKFCTGCHQANGIADFHRSLFDTNINYNALIGIIIAVENQGFQRCVRVAVWGRNIRDNTFHHFANVDSLFGGNPWSIHCRNSDNAFNLLTNPFRIGCWQVNLIDNWNDFQIMFNCQIGICQGLSFNALRSIDNQNCPLTGCQTSGHFIVKVHVSRRINQVKHIGFPVFCLIIQADSTSFDGNTPFPFDVHIVQNLFFHVPLCNRKSLFENPVCQCGFSVVNMGDNAKIPNLFHAIWFSLSLVQRMPLQCASFSCRHAMTCTSSFG